MTAMQFGKVSSVLDALIRVDGKVMTKREFVISRMKDGWTPTKKEGVVSYYGSRWDVKESKPRTEYRLAKRKSHIQDQQNGVQFRFVFGSTS